MTAPTAPTARSVRRRYLALIALRWLPVGLTIPVSVLLVTDRGFTLGEFGIVSAAQGVMILALELPTGGFADSFGRRPVLVAATAIDAVALVVFLGAQSIAVLVVVYLLRGVSRALESGPLDAWYVDAVLADDPDAHYQTGLAHGTAVLSAAIAVGALLSGGIVALGGIGPLSALEVPVVAAIAVDLVAIVGLSTSMSEVRATSGIAAAVRAAAEVPQVVRNGVRLVGASKILLGLVVAEAMWSFGITAFEVLMPPRLAELLGDTDRASAVFGPVTSAAWVASALGAAFVPLLARRAGAARAAVLLRIGQGVTVAAMGFAAGPIGLIAAFMATYVVHGASNPVHQGLLHRQVSGDQRATVVSVNSMIGMPAGALGGVVLGWIADTNGISTAMFAGAVALAAAAAGYLPSHTTVRTDSGPSRSGPSEEGRDELEISTRGCEAPLPNVRDGRSGGGCQR